MPLEAPPPAPGERAIRLNRRYRHHGAVAVLDRALSDPALGRIALVSSFGAESVALLHLVSVVDRTLPVIFVDTEMLFPETFAYQEEVAGMLGLTDLRRVTAHRQALATHDPAGDLHRVDPDACCALRKIEPLETALADFDAWITGRKRFQGGERANLEFFETDAAGRIKVNPLAHWEKGDVQDYMVENRLPRHPLVARGYPSIGCAPCTSPVGEGEDERAGRWRDSEKTECGIHFVDGRIVRRPEKEIAA